MYSNQNIKGHWSLDSRYWHRVPCPFLKQSLGCPFVNVRVRLDVCKCFQYMRWRSWRLWNVRSGRIETILVGHVWKLYSSTVRSVPMSCSLCNNATDSSFLGENVVGRFVLVCIGSVAVYRLRGVSFNGLLIFRVLFLWRRIHLHFLVV